MLPLVYRSALRRTLLPSAVRYNSIVSTNTPSRTRFGSHFLVGFVGAILGVGATGAAGYTWYYFSGVKKAVDRIQEAKVYLDQARDSLSQKKVPSQALWFLRGAVKSYLAFPGSNFMVDQVFDAVNDKVDAHADEANALIATACTQIRDLIQQDGGKFVTKHSVQILGVLKDLKKQLQPNRLEMAEKYEVEKRVNEGLTAVGALRDSTKEKIQDSKLVNLLQQKIGSSSVRRNPINDDASPVPPQPATETTPSISDDDRKSS